MTAAKAGRAPDIDSDKHGGLEAARKDGTVDKIEMAVRAAVQGCRPHYCAQAADLLGIERPECGECGGAECEACAERVAEAIAAHLMPEGVQWPRFGDGEPVRIGDEVEGTGGRRSTVGAVRLSKTGWTLLDQCSEFVDCGICGDQAVRPAPSASVDAVRCADCAYARRTPRGLVCALHGDAGWFETDADGYCWKGERR